MPVIYSFPSHRTPMKMITEFKYPSFTHSNSECKSKNQTLIRSCSNRGLDMSLNLKYLARKSVTIIGSKKDLADTSATCKVDIEDK